MNTDIQNYIVKTTSTAWSPLVEEGVDCTGINWMPLRWEANRPATFLLRFDQGASYPYHNHPGGEEILVLEGSCELEGIIFNKGDYLYTPPNFKHSVKSKNGCTLFLMVPKEVEIL